MPLLPVDSAQFNARKIVAVDVADNQTRGFLMGRLDVDGNFRLLVEEVGTGGGGGTEFDDGDTITTDSQGTLLIGAVDGALPKVARAVRVTDSGHLIIDDGGGSITVDGTVNAVLAEPISVDDNGGSLTVDDGGLTLSIDDGGGVITVDGTVSATQGTSPWVIGDGSGTITVDDGGTTLSIDDGGGAITVDGTVAATQGTTPWTEQGAAAHDAAVSGNPVFIGYRASSALPTAVSADGDLVQAWGDRLGHLMVMRGSPTVASATFAGFDPSGGASTTIIASTSVGSGNSLHLLSMHLGNEGGFGRIVLNSRTSLGVNVAFFNGCLGAQGANAIDYHWQSYHKVGNNLGLAVTGLATGLSAPAFCGYFEYFTAPV